MTGPSAFLDVLDLFYDVKPDRSERAKIAAAFADVILKAKYGRRMVPLELAMIFCEGKKYLESFWRVREVEGDPELEKRTVATRRTFARIRRVPFLFSR